MLKWRSHEITKKRFYINAQVEVRFAACYGRYNTVRRPTVYTTIVLLSHTCLAGTRDAVSPPVPIMQCINWRHQHLCPSYEVYANIT